MHAAEIFFPITHFFQSIKLLLEGNGYKEVVIAQDM